MFEPISVKAIAVVRVPVYVSVSVRSRRLYFCLEHLISLQTRVLSVIVYIQISYLISLKSFYLNFKNKLLSSHNCHSYKLILNTHVQIASKTSTFLPYNSHKRHLQYLHNHQPLIPTYMRLKTCLLMTCLNSRNVLIFLTMIKVEVSLPKSLLILLELWGFKNKLEKYCKLYQVNRIRNSLTSRLF